MSDINSKTPSTHGPRRYWRGGIGRLRRLWHKIGYLLPEGMRVYIARGGLKILKILNARWVNSAKYRQRLITMVNEKTRAIHPVAYRHDEEYTAYIHAQIEKSYHFAHKSPLETALNARTAYLVEQMQRLLPEERQELSLLSVGCRSVSELDYLHEHLAVGEIIGLDLFSDTPRIIIGDMHAMPFEDQRFDIVYACHSLEHAYDVGRVLHEFVRVAKPSGMLVIEVPVNYRTSTVDRWDLKSSKGLLDLLSASVEKVLLSEDTGHESRLIVTLSKKNLLQAS